jgi:hypothetical protein
MALLAGIMGSIAGYKAFNRYQTEADAKTRATVAKIKANNDVQVTAIQIKNQEQRVQVAKQQARSGSRTPKASARPRTRSPRP